MRSEDRLSSATTTTASQPTELDGKILASRFDAVVVRTERRRPATDEKQHSKGNDNNSSTGSSDTFPEKLAETLRSNHVNDAIWWNTEGNVFAMMPKQFTEKVLDKIFQGTKLESFQRKMKRWGFERYVCDIVYILCV